MGGGWWVVDDISFHDERTERRTERRTAGSLRPSAGMTPLAHQLPREKGQGGRRGPPWTAIELPRSSLPATPFSLATASGTRTADRGERRER
jgi:hypothetical protein